MNEPDIVLLLSFLDREDWKAIKPMLIQASIIALLGLALLVW